MTDPSLNSLLRDVTLDELLNSQEKLKEAKEALLVNFANPGYTKADFKRDVEIIRAQEAELENTLKILIEIKSSLKYYKDHPLDEKFHYKIKSDSPVWDPFKQVLPPHEWVPLTADICEYCGKVTSDITGVSAANNPADNNRLVIICNHCFKQQNIK